MTFTKKDVRDEQRENILHFLAYYKQIITLSSGAIILSVTYLGYLQSSENRYRLICNEWILVLSWLLFVSSIILSIIRNRYHIEYRHLESLQLLPNDKNANDLIKKNLEGKQAVFGYIGKFAEYFFIGGIILLILFAIKTGTSILR